MFNTYHDWLDDLWLSGFDTSDLSPLDGFRIDGEDNSIEQAFQQIVERDYPELYDFKKTKITILVGK